MHYIILKNETLLSKKPYASWREIQDEYGDEYVSSLGPWTEKELVSYFEDDFGPEEEWPFTAEEIKKIAREN